MLKYAIFAILLFVTIGISIANETVERLGLQGDYLVVAIIALGVSTLLIKRNVLLLGLVAVLCVFLNLPPESTASLQIDPDFIVALLLGLILLPLVHRLLLR